MLNAHIGAPVTGSCLGTSSQMYYMPVMELLMIRDVTLRYLPHGRIAC